MPDNLTPDEERARQFWAERCGLLDKYEFTNEAAAGALIAAAGMFANRPMPPRWYVEHPPGRN